MITVSLDTAKKLKESGWSKKTECTIAENGTFYGSSIYGTPAPTGEELLKEIPDVFWKCYHWNNAKGNIFDIGKDSTVEYFAKVWIWCKDKGRI